MRIFALLAAILWGASRLLATGPDGAPDSYADYQRLLSWKWTAGNFIVVDNDPPQAIASIGAISTEGANTFTLTCGTIANPKVLKCEYVDAHPIEGVKAIDAIFAKALEWKDIAVAHNVDSLTKSLGSYNGQEYFFRLTGDDAGDGIYLDPASKAPAFSIPAARQLHIIFGFLVFLDNYQGGTHLLESSLIQSRQDADALFK